ncbi:hypothetical protein KSE1242_00560 [Staphylococcus epidermidis]
MRNHVVIQKDDYVVFILYNHNNNIQKIKMNGCLLFDNIKERVHYHSIFICRYHDFRKVFKNREM